MVIVGRDVKLTDVEADQLLTAILHYEQSYLTTMRRELERYATLSLDLPDYLVGYRRIEIFLALDGVIVVRCMADHDSFTLHRNDLRKVLEIAQENVGDWDQAEAQIRASGFAFEETFRHGYAIRIRNMNVSLRTPVSGPIHRYDNTGSVLSILITNTFDSALFGSPLGHSEAESDVSTFMVGHLMGVRSESNSTDLREFEKQTLAALEGTILEFQQLLETGPDESQVQQFLEKNPIILAPNCVRVLPRLKLANQFVTDFVIEFPEQQYVLVEIEAPHHKLYTRDRNPTAAFTHAEKQVMDWREWINETPDYARKVLPGISEPECWVIIGRRPLEKVERKYLERKQRMFHRIRLLTYDDLIDASVRLLENLRNHNELQSG